MNVMLLVVLLSLTAVHQPQTTNHQPQTTAHELLAEVNAMRSDPASFIPSVDAYYREWQSFVKNKKGLKKACDEVKKILKKQKPLAPFQMDSVLTRAALDHAADGRNMGVLGHIGSDGSNPMDRVKRYGTYTSVSECITYGQKTPRLMLAAFLVDENTPDRGHRKAMLSSSLTHVGIAIDTHPQYDHQCVVVLGS
jgi:uncharacterized protein YkwD